MAEPDTLVLGLDASRDGMLDAAVRARRLTRKGVLANARFIVASAEALPSELDGLVEELTIHFPWGSLLRGLIAPQDRILSGLARLLRPGAVATALISLVPRDHQADVPPLDRELALRLAPAYAAHGLCLVNWCKASPLDVAAAHSTWARRLSAERTRPVWRLTLTNPLL
jgi:16S rRNA (adenine(1408)-N(1))-methyltransferase